MSGNEKLIFETKPEHACPAVDMSMEIVRHDSENWSADDGELPVHVQAHNLMASLCTRLCSDGCARETYNHAQSIGLVLPTSADRDTLFALIEGTLGTELLFGESDAEDPAYVEVEIPMASAEELKEIYEKRMSVFGDKELLEKLATHADMSAEEMRELLVRTVTPVKEDTWEELAKLVHGNVRAALGIMAYFQGVFPLFTSTDIEQRSQAESLEARGFSPANAWEISALDIQRLHKFVGEDGIISVPTSAYSSRWMGLAEDDSHIERYEEDDSSITITRDVVVYAPNKPKSLNP